MQCRAKLLALARPTVHKISICRSNEAVMAFLDRLRVPSTCCCLSNAPSALVHLSSSRRKLRSLSSLASQCPHRVLKTRAGHTTPPSPATATSSEAWDACDLSSDPWFRSGSGDSVTDAAAKDKDTSITVPDEEWYKIQAEDDEWFRREEQFYEARILEQEGWAKPHIARHESQPDFLGLSESSLFSQCRMDTFRASGPGGQHRNKTDSGVRLTHLPTGVVAQAVEDRSQHKNRAVAMNRLRMLIASKVRRPVKLQGYNPPPELLRLLPPEPGRKGSGDKIGVNHPDFAKGIQALLDLLSASKGYVFYAAALLRVSPNVISKILTMDKTVLQGTNELLVSKGQKPFK